MNSKEYYFEVEATFGKKISPVSAQFDSSSLNSSTSPENYNTSSAKREITLNMRLRTWLININTTNSKQYLQGDQPSEIVENSSRQACQFIVT